MTVKGVINEGNVKYKMQVHIFLGENVGKSVKGYHHEGEDYCDRNAEAKNASIPIWNGLYQATVYKKGTGIKKS